MISITLPPDELELVEERAQELGITVEQYVYRLIWKDIMNAKGLLGSGQN